MTHKRGFTLIELSIVLVILGLIVGGIVGGQSLLHATTIQSTIREYKGWVTAYNAFQLQYDAIPGDFSEGYAYFSGGNNSSCGTDNTVDSSTGCNGDGNGILDSRNENHRAWMHLQKAEIIAGAVAENLGGGGYRQACPHSCPALTGTAYNIPHAKGLGDTIGWELFGPASYSNLCETGSCTIYGKSGTFLWLGQSTESDFLREGALTGKDGAFIDKKIDDGISSMGTVMAQGDDSACTSQSSTYYNLDTITPSASHSYELASDIVDCIMMFYFGD